MKNEETIYDKNQGQNVGQNNSAEVNENVNNEATELEEQEGAVQEDEVEAGKEAAQKSSKGSTLRKAAAGMGAGILLGSLSSFAIPKSSGEDVVSEEEVEVIDESHEDFVGPVLDEDYQPENPWSDGNVEIASGVSDDMSFGEAFSAARAEVGSGGAFEWRGNVYSTFTTEEWNNMSAAEKADYNSHFAWNGESSAQSVEEVEVVSVEPAGEDIYVGPETGTGGGDEVKVEVIDDEPKVEILGVMHEGDITYGSMTLNDEPIVLVDVDGGNFDYIAKDLDGDGEITDNEIGDISSAGISVAQFQAESQYGVISDDAGSAGVEPYVNE